MRFLRTDKCTLIKRDVTDVIGWFKQLGSAGGLDAALSIDCTPSVRQPGRPAAGPAAGASAASAAAARQFAQPQRSNLSSLKVKVWKVKTNLRRTGKSAHSGWVWPKTGCQCLLFRTFIPKMMEPKTLTGPSLRTWSAPWSARNRVTATGSFTLVAL